MHGGREDHSEEKEKNILTVEKVPLLTKQRYTKDTRNSLSAIKKNLITINVSGRKFLIDRSYLEQYPTTLLGSAEIEEFWDPRYNEYFFDTHRDAFESIFDFYLYGKLYPHPHVPTQMHHENVEFFRIMSVFEQEERLENGGVHVCMKSNSGWSKIKATIHATLEDPNYHFVGKVYGWADLFFIFLSIATMLVETIPKIHAKSDEAGSTEGSVFFSIETLTVVFFTFDVLLRLVVVPNRWDFLRCPATWLDMLTVAPYYIEFFLPQSRLESMKVLRIARVARVLKLIKKNKRLQLIAEVLVKSVNELCMLVIVWAMNITVAGIVFYYLEEPANNLVKSGVDGMWWAIVTMSTVGYGDIYPTSFAGKIFSTFFIWVSMVFLALPLTIIVSTFNKQYEKKKTLTLRKKGAVSKLLPIIRNENK